MENEILQFLKDREDQYVKSPVIESHFGIVGATVRSIIHDLRVAGNPIVSGYHGYSYTEDMDELNHSINNLNSRKNNIHEAEIGLRRARRRILEN